jgi:hypothetical protein
MFKVDGLCFHAQAVRALLAARPMMIAFQQVAEEAASAEGQSASLVMGTVRIRWTFL